MHNCRTQIPLHTWTSTHLYTHTQVQPQVLAHMCTPIYMCVQACTASHMGTHVNMHACAHLHSVCMFVSTCTPNPCVHTSKPVHTCTCAHTDTRTSAQVQPPPLPPVHTCTPHRATCTLTWASMAPLAGVGLLSGDGGGVEEQDRCPPDYCPPRPPEAGA